MARTEDGEKVKEFLYLVQALAVAAFVRSNDELMTLAGILARANALSRKLPSDKGALSSALEFCDFYLPGFNPENSTHATQQAWLVSGDPSASESTEELVDGKWRRENPKWVGLHGDRAADLDIMAALREQSDRKVSDLVQAGIGCGHSVRMRLLRLERQGFVTKSRARPQRWSLTPNVCA
ncbi:MAG: hypothetical protein LCH99_07885 [Proteobacteria bacterium]|nr:hypothetical protein [Pseudomonadota bacterium]